MNPVEKTATELRRSINRLEIFRVNNKEDDLVVGGTISALLQDLTAAYDHIPDEFKKED
ncbi:hypothetical protein D3C76_1817860 [compost metagenome]